MLKPFVKMQDAQKQEDLRFHPKINPVLASVITILLLVALIIWNPLDLGPPPLRECEHEEYFWNNFESDYVRRFNESCVADIETFKEFKDQLFTMRILVEVSDTILEKVLECKESKTGLDNCPPLILQLGKHKSRLALIEMQDRKSKGTFHASMVISFPKRSILIRTWFDLNVQLTEEPSSNVNFQKYVTQLKKTKSRLEVEFDFKKSQEYFSTTNTIGLAMNESINPEHVIIIPEVAEFFDKTTNSQKDMKFLTEVALADNVRISGQIGLRGSAFGVGIAGTTLTLAHIKKGKLYTHIDESVLEYKILHDKMCRCSSIMNSKIPDTTLDTWKQCFRLFGEGKWAEWPQLKPICALY